MELTTQERSKMRSALLKAGQRSNRHNCPQRCRHGKVENIVRYLCDNFGYEDVAADHEHHVTIGVSCDTIAGIKKDYAEAKRGAL